MIGLGMVGVGTIATTQHAPVIAAHSDFELLATASHHGALDGVPRYTELNEMLAAEPRIDAVVLCVPPSVRTRLAHAAVAAGKAVFLEKPPGQTVAEMNALIGAAQSAGVTLFASWHSRYAAAVEPLRARLAERKVRRVVVTWREDVRTSHPGQDWIWKPGGFGSFDPGINVLSILTYVLPKPFSAASAHFKVPSNASQPIYAEVLYRDTDGVPVECVFDFDKPDPRQGDVVIETDGPTYMIQRDGELLLEDGKVLVDAPDEEYRALYDRFAVLLREGRSDVDIAPLIHCADAFMIATREVVKPFSESDPPRASCVQTDADEML